MRLQLRCCSYSTSWTHSCHPPWLAFELPRKHFPIHLQRKAPGTCLSGLCWSRPVSLPAAQSLISYPESFQKTACFPVPICQEHNSGQTGTCLPSTMPGSWREVLHQSLACTAKLFGLGVCKYLLSLKTGWGLGGRKKPVTHAYNLVCS